MRSFELLGKRDLVGEFGDRSGTGWLTTEDLLPSDYDEVMLQAMTYNSELYDALQSAKTEIMYGPRKLVSEMQSLAQSGRSTLYPELPQLQIEFRAALTRMTERFDSIRDNLLPKPTR